MRWQQVKREGTTPLDRSNKWYILAVATAVMTLNYVDRNVMNVIIEPVKHEFGLSDSAMGLLSGLAHAIAFSVLVLPLGALADRVNRVRLVSIALVIWSLLTALSAFATGFMTMFLSRMGVGAAEAAGPSTTVSLLSDSFTPKERPTAIGIYYMHASIGTGLIFLIGGWTAEHFGWRACFLLAGFPGLLLALLIATTLREPRRTEEPFPDKPVKPTIGAFARDVSHNRSLQIILAAGTVATIAQMSLLAWIASFFVRAHHLSLVDAGILVASIAGPAKAFGSLISGPLTKLMAGDDRRATWRSPGLMLALTVPLAWAMISANTTGQSLTWAILLGVAAGGWAAPAIVILLESAPPSVRGSSVGLYQLCVNLIGSSLGPFATGLISDLLGGDAAIGQALATSMSINLVAALGFYLACRSLPAAPQPVPGSAIT